MDSGSSTTASSATSSTRRPTNYHHQGSYYREISDWNRSSSSSISFLASMERRTVKTYRYGIGLVCIGATLNWLGFAQGHGYVDPLRYVGVTCVIGGSICVCIAMCRWLGRPFNVSGDDDDYRSRQSGLTDVHVINVSVPLFLPPQSLEEFRPSKPPDYEVVTGVFNDPPPYDEAIKINSSSCSTQLILPIHEECPNTEQEDGEVNQVNLNEEESSSTLLTVSSTMSSNLENLNFFKTTSPDRPNDLKQLSLSKSLNDLSIFDSDITTCSSRQLLLSAENIHVKRDYIKSESLENIP